ncbi:MAG: alkaline phosphatase family protein [Bacteroidales bacterium]|nr:alkaline phosphatase family protein [Bacteroidales bacterium]
MLSKSFFIILLLNLFLSVSSSAQLQKEPRIVVGIVIDQMRYDCLYRYGRHMGENGFKRLISSGTNCTNAHYEYLVTESAPGFATIYTGANPCSHGIIANSWYQRLERKVQTAVGDKNYTAIGGSSSTGASSPLQLRGTTLGDEMKLATFKRSKVISVSLNHRSAILSAGRLADGVYWLDDSTGNFITNSYYTGVLPQWVNDFNNKHLCDEYIYKGWYTIKSIKQYIESLPDNSVYEIGVGGQTTFPYNLDKLKQNMGYAVMRYTPHGNSLTTEFALQAIESENLGGDEFPDLLLINYAVPGYVSDAYGIRSIELEDVYLRLDTEIAKVLEKLDKYIGHDDYVVFLTADRGSSDCPTFLNEIGIPGNQINCNSNVAVLNSYLSALYGQAKWIDRYHRRNIYLNQTVIESKKLKLSEVQNMAAQLMMEFSGIDNAMPASSFLTSNYTSGIWQQAQNSFCSDKSGDIVLNFAPGWQEVTETSQDYSVSAQNSPYNHDTHVPLVFFGKNIRRKTVNRRISITDITPTLATLLSICAPDYCSGKTINEVMEY